MKVRQGDTLTAPMVQKNRPHSRLAENSGVTLESTLDKAGVKMPQWDFYDSESVQAWKYASETYALSASGEVRALIGVNVNPDGIWKTIELPALIRNQNVTKIILIDPKTRTEITIFER